MAVLDDLQQFFPKFAAHYLQRIIEGHIQGITFNVSVCRGIELIHPAETWIGIGTTFLAEIRGRGWQVVIEQYEFHLILQFINQFFQWLHLWQEEGQHGTVLINLRFLKFPRRNQCRHFQTCQRDEPVYLFFLHDILF